MAVVLFASIVVPSYPWLVSHRNAFGGDSRSGLCQYIAEKMPAAAVIVADAAAEIEAAQRWRGDRASKIEAAEYAPSLGSLEDLRARGVTHVSVNFQSIPNQYVFDTKNPVKLKVSQKVKNIP